MAGTRDPETLAIPGSSDEADRCGDPCGMDAVRGNVAGRDGTDRGRPEQDEMARAGLAQDGLALEGARDRAERRMADAVRVLAIDAVREAGSGDAALPLGMADAATMLWCRHLRFDATDPRWPDRDRFVLSAGQGAMLLYALLHLTGHGGMDEGALRRFRQIDSPAAGMPEYGEHPAVETTTGPPGQGLAMAVGMALAERMLAARFGRSLVDHRCWVVASTADLVQGVSQEAACLAGALRLEKLTVLWDEAEAPEDGAAEDLVKRFAAAGWTTRRIDGHAPADIAAALTLALRSRKPTLIACRTLIGAAVPRNGRAPDAGMPAEGRTGLAGARDALGWAAEPFVIPEDVADPWLRAGTRGTGARRAWLKRLANHPLRAEFERIVAGRLPESWHEATAALRAELAETRPGSGTGAVSRRTLDSLMGVIPELAGGTAGGMAPQGQAPISAASFAGRHIEYQARLQAMAACTNGMAVHGGVLAYADGALLDTDAMRPALRLAAQMRQRLVHVLTRDGIGLGQDGPACQPVEQLAALRAMPGLFVLRPADALETVECWELAIRRADGPSLLVLSELEVPALRTDAAENRCARGGYVLAEADGPRAATLIASGSEVAIAMAARALLAEDGVPAAVVSLPCWELFAAQDESTRAMVLGTALRVGIEAGCDFGWERWLGPDGIFIGMTGYGASAPPDTLYRHFGITPEAIAAAVRKRMPQPSPTEGI